MTGRRIAVLSHVIPPMPSGQAVVMGRIIEAAGPRRHLLIASPRAAGSALLPAGCEVLPPEPVWRRLPPTLEFHLRRLLRARATGRILDRHDPEVLVACSGDVFDMPAALTACSSRGVPLVSWLFDDYAGQWESGPFRRIAAREEGRLMRGSRSVIVTNELMADEYGARHGIGCRIVRNPYGPGWAGCAGPPRGGGGVPVLLYSGSVYGVNRDSFICLAEALSRIRGSALEIYSGQSAGDMGSLGIPTGRMRFHDHAAPEVLQSAVRAVDALYVPLGFSPEYSRVVRTASPAKFGEYLVSGRPVLVHAPRDSFAARFVAQRRCGLLVTSLDPGELSSAIAELASDRHAAWEAAGRAFQAALPLFSPERSAADYLSALGGAV